VLTPLLGICLLGYLVYFTHKHSADSEMILDALRLAKGCEITMLRRVDANENNIRNNKMSLPAILQLNQVLSLDQLLQKEKILACK
jgi:hypothetical protein